jgi:hypothetical protein
LLLTLKCTVSPALTLTSVAKPTMEGSPGSTMLQSEGGVPGS